MGDTIALRTETSGMPTIFGPPAIEKLNWPSGSTLLSALLNIMPGTIVTPRREGVMLTRAHQRVMDRALRRSVRIIA